MQSRNRKKCKNSLKKNGFFRSQRETIRPRLHPWPVLIYGRSYPQNWSDMTRKKCLHSAPVTAVAVETEPEIIARHQREAEAYSARGALYDQAAASIETAEALTH